MKYFNFALTKSGFLPALAGADCGSCDVDNPQIPPQYLTTGTKPRLSGIIGWIAKHCSVSFTDITDQLEWETYLAAGLIFGRLDGCTVSGNKPLATPTTQTIGGCAATFATNVTDVYTMTDNGNDALLTVNDLYCFMQGNKDQYDFGFVTCDYRFHKFRTPTFSFFDDAETEDNTGIYSWGGTFNFTRPADSCREMCPLPMLANIREDINGAAIPVPVP